jgi:hypothetical protein
MGTPIMMKEIHRMIYDSFNSNIDSINNSVFGSSAMRNQIQGRLLNNVAAQKSKPTAETLNQIYADLTLSNSLGYITDQSYEIIMKKLS